MCHSIAHTFTMSPPPPITHTRACTHTQPSSSLLPSLHPSGVPPWHTHTNTRTPPHTHAHTHTHTVSPFCKTFLQMPNVAFGHISETDRWTDRQADRTSHSLLCGCSLIIWWYRIWIQAYSSFSTFALKADWGGCVTQWKTLMSIRHCNSVAIFSK